MWCDVHASPISYLTTDLLAHDKLDNHMTLHTHPSLHQHHTQLPDDAEEVQEEVRVAARAAEIAAEKAALGMTDFYALFSLLLYQY